MTPVGHTLTGLTIGYLAVPYEMPPKPKAIALGVFAFLANLPDIPVTRFIITHSFIIVTIAVILIIAEIKFFAGNHPYLPNRVLFGGALAWYSHLLLDSFYDRHGADGFEAFWPILGVKLSLPIPWLLQADKEEVLGWHNASVGLFEAVTFGIPLLVAILAKHWLHARGRTSAAESL